MRCQTHSAKTCWQRVLLWAWLLSFASCGDDGNNNDDHTGGSPPPTSVSPPTSQPLTTVKGRVVLGSKETPAVGYEIWVLDHTDGSYGRFHCDGNGAFSIPLSIFRVDHEYTLHISTLDNLLAQLNWGSAATTLASALKYAGGYGFEVDTIKIPTNSRGEPAVPNNTLTAQPGGGFTLSSRLLAFRDLPAPAGIDFANVGSQLDVLDPYTLLNSFYRQQTDTAMTKALTELSRVQLVVTTTADNLLLLAALEQTGDWLKASRIAQDQNANHSDSPLWETQSYNIQKLGPSKFASSIFSGTLLKPSQFVSIRLTPPSGPLFALPRPVGRVFLQPPKVTAIGFGNNKASDIDYNAGSGENGLSTPFCYSSGAATLVYTMPASTDQVYFSAQDLPIIEVLPTYYAISADGRSVAVAVGAEHYTGDYQAISESTLEEGLTKRWDPTVATLRLTWDADHAPALSSGELIVPEALLLKKVKDAKIVSIRLALRMKDKQEVMQTTSALWLDLDCN